MEDVKMIDLLGDLIIDVKKIGLLNYNEFFGIPDDEYCNDIENEFWIFTKFEKYRIYDQCNKYENVLTIEGDINKLINAEIIKLEKSVKYKENERWQEYDYMWTDVKITTNKGEVILKWSANVRGKKLDITIEKYNLNEIPELKTYKI